MLTCLFDIGVAFDVSASLDAGGAFDDSAVFDIGRLFDDGDLFDASGLFDNGALLLDVGESFEDDGPIDDGVAFDVAESYDAGERLEDGVALDGTSFDVAALFEVSKLFEDDVPLDGVSCDVCVWLGDTSWDAEADACKELTIDVATSFEAPSDADIAFDNATFAAKAGGEFILEVSVPLGIDVPSVVGTVLMPKLEVLTLHSTQIEKRTRGFCGGVERRQRSRSEQNSRLLSS